ncbi:MAG: DUF2851 family protein, partial [Desulfobacterium sp.]
IAWKSGGRPTNSPERRLAVLVNWMRQFGDTPLLELGKYAEESSPEQLVEHIMTRLEVSDNLWDNFVNFNTKKSLPAKISGKSFVLEVVVNVIFPAIYAMTKFDIFKNPEFVAKQIEKSWQILPIMATAATVGKVENRSPADPMRNCWQSLARPWIL